MRRIVVVLQHLSAQGYQKESEGVMNKGVKLTAEEVKTFGAKADLFSQNGKGKPKVKIIGEVVLFVTCWYRNGRKYTKEHSKTSVEAIFKRIERLYDRNGVIVARRLNKRSELLATGKGECRRFAEPTVQEIYHHIQHHH